MLNYFIKSKVAEFSEFSLCPILPPSEDKKLLITGWRQDNEKGKNQALTKFNETVWPDSSVGLRHVISSNEFLLKLIQEREGQNIWVIFSAQHHVAHSQRANKTTV